jgi:hypothetical protein
MLGLLGVLGDIGPTCGTDAGAEPARTPITDKTAIKTINPWQTRFMFTGIVSISTT